MAYFSDTAAKPNALLGWVQSTLAYLAKRRRANRIYRQTFNELAQLGNRELSDLGISRSNIRFIAREAADLT